MNVRLAEPDYELVWPRALFKAEAAKLLNRRELGDWNDRCEVLLEDAFVRGYESGPLGEFREIPEIADADPWGASGTSRSTLTAKQQFLRDLMGNADRLHEDDSHRRPYWRERMSGQRRNEAVTREDTVRDFVELVNELEDAGYFERQFGKDCVDDSYADRPALLIKRALGVDDLWPLPVAALAEDLDLFFDLIEFLHDSVARPLRRWMHSYGGCGWHHGSFELESGRIAYRWRVNKVLDRGGIGFRLADEGADIGRLVAVTDDARATLVHELILHDGGESSDQVRHAIELFRARGADRNQKRSAVVVLALLLEERRHNVLATALAKKDSGALFEIANGFHIRHQDARQRRDYDEFYLDWIFWVYLSTIELTNRVIDEQSSV
ncbi:hypothetical protein [Amycolatopsis dendrobii]|uniref:Uncharacterized protein n=1 Tax=Amycolatopsis dendrobii TaxID=2760662 RepID=A0A7W3W3C0_9PSEU|nr:hypothetical protein [Amycolatopsis dendrobii]MBB1158093.1 hypothetical protein [Amycolatopsis dendrobii]